MARYVQDQDDSGNVPRAPQLRRTTRVEVHIRGVARTIGLSVEAQRDPQVLNRELRDVGATLNDVHDTLLQLQTLREVA